MHAVSLWAHSAVSHLAVKQLSAFPLQPAVSSATSSTPNTFMQESVYIILNLPLPSPPCFIQSLELSVCVSPHLSFIAQVSDCSSIVNSVSVFIKPLSEKQHRDGDTKTRGVTPREGKGVFRAGVDTPIFQKLSMRWGRLSTKWRQEQTEEKNSQSWTAEKGWQRGMESRIDSGIIALCSDSNATRKCSSPTRFIGCTAGQSLLGMQGAFRLYQPQNMRGRQREACCSAEVPSVRRASISPVFLLLEWIHHSE